MDYPKPTKMISTAIAPRGAKLDHA